MKRIHITLATLAASLVLVACASVGGAAIGAGIGSIAGDTRAGALIGGGIGLLYDLF